MIVEGNKVGRDFGLGAAGQQKEADRRSIPYWKRADQMSIDRRSTVEEVGRIVRALLVHRQEEGRQGRETVARAVVAIAVAEEAGTQGKAKPRWELAEAQRELVGFLLLHPAAKREDVEPCGLARVGHQKADMDEESVGQGEVKSIEVRYNGKGSAG